MEKGLYRDRVPVNILGKENNLNIIEFNNGITIKCADSELLIEKEKL